MTDALNEARTWLFVPGDRPDRFAKAAASGADVVIADLDDAVAAAQKASARSAVVDALEAGSRLVVRVNPSDTAAGREDVEALAGADARPLAVVVARAERRRDLEDLAQDLGCPLIPLVESAKGLVAAPDLASAPSVVRLAFGSVDFSLDVGCDDASDVLAYARSALVVASRAAGTAPPIDSPSLQIADLARVAEATVAARRLGMGGKLCIHPSQVPVVAGAFKPTVEQIEAARSVVAAAGAGGAVALDGQMIDRPVIERARRVLLAAGVAA